MILVEEHLEAELFALRVDRTGDLRLVLARVRDEDVVVGRAEHHLADELRRIRIEINQLGAKLEKHGV